ncbi:hypothetical protein PSEUDO9AZ_40824 [Pseudomonas sp. 9AZ]|nr:hypothetical protein PSEUDO9AZ_40824 [Pseudomonas sp. 9AZ]
MPPTPFPIATKIFISDRIISVRFVMAAFSLKASLRSLVAI